MTERFFLKYRKESGKDSRLGTEEDRKRLSEPRSKHTYLHDHRAEDSLVEYLDNIEE